MATFEMPNGEEVEVPDGFAQTVDMFGMSKRTIGVEGAQDSVVVLAPRPMGDLPNELTSESVTIPEAVRIFVKTPMEPFRLAAEDRPSGGGVATTIPGMGETIVPPPEMPPTIAVPENGPNLPFSEGDIL